MEICTSSTLFGTFTHPQWTGEGVWGYLVANCKDAKKKTEEVLN